MIPRQTRILSEFNGSQWFLLNDLLTPELSDYQRNLDKSLVSFKFESRE